MFTRIGYKGYDALCDALEPPAVLLSSNELNSSLKFQLLSYVYNSWKCGSCT